VTSKRSICYLLSRMHIVFWTLGRYELYDNKQHMTGELKYSVSSIFPHIKFDKEAAAFLGR
jgi:hypothetical protein